MSQYVSFLHYMYLGHFPLHTKNFLSKLWHIEIKILASFKTCTDSACEHYRAIYEARNITWCPAARKFVHNPLQVSQVSKLFINLSYVCAATVSAAHDENLQSTDGQQQITFAFIISLLACVLVGLCPFCWFLLFFLVTCTPIFL